ncbi:hypothetical protein [Roseiconus lacunae]|uniref:Uncharacterized protein n=1 Tax=Roseiconus lacunae TaxID=2605694 RepID=A0ABT7PES8_9BACT|nr:hypothetical protein [Roseiconus lacunae]MCD0458705.1 hypothetical protein [Roseiconus lacunae]MDM4014994.1 hypothetical protein [Roseiconus lacunae]WRQ50230.1 hypothetical protein U8335_25155 [Stieleria sp. HD01]
MTRENKRNQLRKFNLKKNDDQRERRERCRDRDYPRQKHWSDDDTDDDSGAVDVANE